MGKANEEKEWEGSHDTASQVWDVCCGLLAY